MLAESEQPVSLDDLKRHVSRFVPPEKAVRTFFRKCRRRNRKFTDDLATQIYYGSRDFVYDLVKTLKTIPGYVRTTGPKGHVKVEITEAGRQHLTRHWERTKR